MDVTNARASNPSDPPDGSPYPAPRLIGFFSIAAGANTLALDSKRGILYVGLSAPSAGVAVYDMTDPCTMGLENHTAGENDPRRIAFIATPSQNVNTPFALDADTGLIFGASDADTSGTGRAFALSLFGPPMRFVADTNRDGIWEDVAEGIPLGIWNPGKSTPPYRPDVVRVLANIFGGAGKELVVELASASTGGFTLSELRAGFPRTRTYITLARESDDPAEFGYNRYLSPPIVLIADPRARKDYAIKDKPQEREDGAADASKDYACRNCLVASGYAAELALYAADTDGVTPGTPAKKAIEQWAGEKLIVRLAWDTASESALKIKATYLAGLDLQRVNAAIKTTRGDLTPALQQVPAQNPSLFTTEAGVAVDTHAGGARMAWTDLSIKGRGLDFVLSRYYVSDILNAGPFGRNEDSPLFARLRDLPTGDVDFYPGDGSRHTFRFVPGANGVGAHFQAPKGVFLDLYRKPDLTFLLVYPDQTRLFFDETGRLAKLIDRQTTTEDNSDGNAMQFFYDGSGHLLTVADPTNRQVHFDYNDDTAGVGSRGLVSKVTDSDGRVVTYAYNSSGQLTDVDGPDPASISSRKPHTNLTWNTGNGNLKTTLYKSGELTIAKDGETRQVFQINYDAAKPATINTLTYGGGALQIAYSGATTTLTDPNANGRTYRHDNAGRALEITEPGGAKTTFVYDSEGRMMSLVRPEGGSTSYGYASATGVSRLPLGNVKTAVEYPRPGSREATLGVKSVTTAEYGAANLPTSLVVDGVTTSV